MGINKSGFLKKIHGIKDDILSLSFVFFIRAITTVVFAVSVYCFFVFWQIQLLLIIILSIIFCSFIGAFKR